MPSFLAGRQRERKASRQQSLTRLPLEPHNGLAQVAAHEAGHGPTLFAGLSKHVDLKLVSRLEFASGAVAMRYEPRR
jgi:hypothetical protein